MTADPTTTAPATPDQLDLDAIAREWLVQCGPCDYGLANMGCQCPSGDHRPVMLRLVDELRRLRAERDLPDGITLDLARWRCGRCAMTGTWTGDDDPAAVDPLLAAADEARRHAADHKRWDAERAERRARRQAAGTGGEHHG